MRSSVFEQEYAIDAPQIDPLLKKTIKKDHELYLESLFTLDYAKDTGLKKIKFKKRCCLEDEIDIIDDGMSIVKKTHYKIFKKYNKRHKLIVKNEKRRELTIQTSTLEYRKMKKFNPTRKLDAFFSVRKANVDTLKMTAIVDCSFVDGVFDPNYVIEREFGIKMAEISKNISVVIVETEEDTLNLMRFQEDLMKKNDQLIVLGKFEESSGIKVIQVDDFSAECIIKNLREFGVLETGLRLFKNSKVSEFEKRESLLGDSNVYKILSSV